MKPVAELMSNPANPAIDTEELGMIWFQVPMRRAGGRAQISSDSCGVEDVAREIVGLDLFFLWKIGRRL